ncbi:hypothetical protein ACH3XW_39595 [Acanthocheilonema viteae]
MYDIETTEEMEDRILLGRAVNIFNSPAIHFKSRLSLVSEGHDAVDEGDEEEYEDEGEDDENDDDDTRPLEAKLVEESQASMERIRNLPGGRGMTTLIRSLINGHGTRKRQCNVDVRIS